MTRVDELVAGCVEAMGETEPRRAVREVLERSLADGKLEAELEGSRSGLNVLYNAADLTVLNVVWPPRFTIVPHDHRMWAAIAIYGGREDNAFFRRQGSTIVPSGGKELARGDVLLIGDDAIHSVHNPAAAHTGGIHVYGGDFIGTPRSQWDPTSLEEEPWNLAEIQAAFAAADKDIAP
jgi:predicted metal-dependent enzyme (double-stranded beta helix superfamily)